MNDLSKKIYGLLTREVSPMLAKAAMETRAKRVGTTLDELGLAHLEPLAKELQKGLSGYVGEAKASALATQVRGLD